jgi:SAM-dependent methyltransferase
MKRYDISDYNEYVKAQLKRTSQKWGGKTFRVNLQKFIKLMKNVYEITGKIDSICCMGIRSGNEYHAFHGGHSGAYEGLNEFNDSEIYGVDLEGMVTGVGKNCFPYDFSKLPKDWENKFGMVYSNSLDHAFDVKLALDEWYRVTRPNGFIVLELSSGRINKADINSFEPEDMNTLFDETKFEKIKVWGMNVLLRVIK